MQLRAGDWLLEILPEQGAAMARLDHAGRPVLQPLAGRDPNDTPAGAFWMLPWTNRIDGGVFPWEGVAHRFPLTHPEEGNALHGLGRARPWQVASLSPHAVVLEQELAEAPFHYAARLGLSLAPEGLTLALTLRNTGATPCPMGMGWHPWLARPAGTSLEFAARHRFLKDERKLPVAVEVHAGVAGGEAEWLGSDDHFAGWDGHAVLRRPDMLLTLQAEGDWGSNLQFYAPRRHPVLCLEPVTHVPDVINRPEFAEYGAMRVLAPGEALSARILLTAGP